MKKFSSLGNKLVQFTHSIRFRLVLWFAAILMLVLVVFSAFIYYSQSRDLYIDSLGRLDRRMAGLEIIPDGEDKITGLGGLSLSPLQDTDVFLLLAADGQVLSNQGPIPAQDALQVARIGLQERARRGEPAMGSITWAGRLGSHGTYLFSIAPIRDNSEQARLVLLGAPLDPSGQLRQLWITLLIGSLITLAIALGGGFWLADRAIRPVQAITHAARTISETDLSRRLKMDSQDELGELANTFDAMLARLQAAFERQRQFIADASHELRTPLTIVHLEASRALASRRSHQEYERTLGVIRSENDIMTRLVNDLLTLARLDAGQALLNKEPLDLSDVALEAVERLTPLATRNHVRMEAGDLPEAHILGDRQYVLGMICNLLENGIKYTTGEDRCVRIETGVSDNLARVYVSDNGPGIAPEHLPHLFDRFYRVDKARSRSADDETETRSTVAAGSGLGLSIAQWIAQAHGGELRAESALGVGTTFEARFTALSPPSPPSA